MNKDVKELTEENPGVVCQFCHFSTINSLEWGPMYQLDGVTVHYFCMLFSAGLSQNGEDDEGILGFLPPDIRKESRRGDKLKCKYCRKPNATIGCSVPTCKASYHYPCGLQAACVFQFIGNFESYCPTHKKVDKMTLHPNADWDCPICFCVVSKDETPLLPPCCKKRVFHKVCIMTMAKTHGKHFFKCPLCNDKDEFSKEMRMKGVYLPDRDAAWETEPNAFADHARLHNRCDADECQCPKGREHSSKSDSKPWKLVRCGGCGAFATHRHCSNLRNLTWRCPTCEAILSDKRRGELLNSSRIQRPFYGTSDNEEESDLGSVMSVREAVMECSNSDAVGAVTSSSTSLSSDTDDDNEDRRPKIFDQRYGRNFVVDMDSEDDAGSTGDEQDEIQTEKLFIPSNKQSGKTSATATLNRSSEEIVYPHNVSHPVRTASLGNIPPAPPSVSFPPLGRDLLIRSDKRKSVEGRIEIGDTPEIVSESKSQIIKIFPANASTIGSFLSASTSKQLKKSVADKPSYYETTLGKHKATEGSTIKVRDSTKTEDKQAHLENTASKQSRSADDPAVVHVGKTKPQQLPVVDLEEEGSDSDLEVVSEKIIPVASSTKMSAAIVDLLNKKHEGVKSKPSPPIPVVRLGLDDHHNDQIEVECPTGNHENVNREAKRTLTFSSFRTGVVISTAFLQMIHRGKKDHRNLAYFSGRKAESKNEKTDVIDLDSDDDGGNASSEQTSAGNSQGEAPTGKNKRERRRQSPTSDTRLVKAGSCSSSKRPRK